MAFANHLPALGIYTVNGEGKTVGSLAEKIPRGTFVFMVTQIAPDVEMLQWCAELVPAGLVPAGKQKAGAHMWRLDGHPKPSFFILDGSDVLECDEGLNRRRKWCLSTDASMQGGFFREHVSPPLKVFPSDNFSAAVLDGKAPHSNEPYSPSTQIVVEACAYVGMKLTDDPIERQKALIKLYTAETPLYHEMNAALREDSLHKMKYFGSYIKELRDVFKTDHKDQIITPFEGKVWRGITFPDAAAALEDFAVGTVFVWPSFTSMTTNKGVAINFGNVTFEIECKPPAGCYDDDIPEYAPASVSEFSDYPGEAEVLFPPNISFRVLRIDLPNDSNQFSHPLVVCKVVGFDTDGGIQRFDTEHKLSSGTNAEPSGSSEPAPVESPDVSSAAQQADTEEHLRKLDHFRARLDEETSRFNMTCSGLEHRLLAVEGTLKGYHEKEQCFDRRPERRSLEPLELRIASLESAQNSALKNRADSLHADRGGTLAVARLESKVLSVEKELRSMHEQVQRAGEAVQWHSLDIKRVAKDAEESDQRIERLITEVKQQMANTDKSIRISLEKQSAGEQRQNLSEQRVRTILASHDKGLQELDKRYQELPQLLASNMGQLRAGMEQDNVGARRARHAGAVAQQDDQVWKNQPLLPGMPGVY